MKLLSIFSAAVFAILFSGCAYFERAQSDPATGQWEGSWYVGNSTQPAGGLKADVTRTGPNQWEAIFDAEYGQQSRYQVVMPGKLQDGVVIFQGDVDLGQASGGVFNWSGRIEGDTFNGVYTSRGISGTFKLNRIHHP
jgi:hypothetical protein